MASNQKRRISEIYEKALNDNWVKVIDNLEPRNIVDYLIPYDIITIEERGVICRIDDRSSRIQKLMDILLLRGDRRFEDFLEVLKNQSYEWLYKDISRTIDKNKDNPTCSMPVRYEHGHSEISALQLPRRDDPTPSYNPVNPLEHEFSGQENLDVTDSLPYERQRLNSCPSKSGNETMKKVSPDRPVSYGASATSSLSESNVYDDALSKPSDYESVLQDQSTTQDDYEQLHTGQSPNEEVHTPSRQRSSSSLSERAQTPPPSGCLPPSPQYTNTSISKEDSFSENQPLYSNMEDSQKPFSECNRIVLASPETITMPGAISQRPPERLREIEKCQGWSPSVSDNNKKKVPSASGNEDGNYYLWYSGSADSIVLTVRKSDEKRGCLNYKVRSTQEGRSILYFFHKDTKLESIEKLMEFTGKHGLALPQKPS